MELWMLVVLLVVLAAMVVTINRVIQQQARSKQEADSFFEEANEVMGMKLNMEGSKNFHQKKRSIFDQHKVEKKWDEERYELDLQGAPEDSWQRELPQSEIATLKSALLRRAICLVPVLHPFQQEATARFNLLQRGLITEKAWQSTMELRDTINKEVMDIRMEAECLQPGFGFSGAIFQDAKKFHEHETRKKVEEELKRQFMTQAMNSGLSPDAAQKAWQERVSQMEAQRLKVAEV